MIVLLWWVSARKAGPRGGHVGGTRAFLLFVSFMLGCFLRRSCPAPKAFFPPQPHWRLNENSLGEGLSHLNCPCLGCGETASGAAAQVKAYFLRAERAVKIAKSRLVFCSHPISRFPTVKGALCTDSCALQRK